MKTYKLLILTASAGLVFGTMTGCGGGSDGDGGGGTAPSTGFTPEKIEIQVGEIADQLGCEYTEITTAQATQQGIALSLKTTKIISNVIQTKKDTPILAETITEPGNCGGSLTINGSNYFSASYTFNDYCMEDVDNSVKVEIDGSLEVSTNEAGDKITASTPVALTVTSHNPNTGENVSVTVDLDKATLTMNEDGSMKIAITDLTVKDNNEGKTYAISDFTADMDMNTGDINFNGNIYNPNLDIGELAIRGAINSSTGEGQITATDVNGVKVELTSTSTEGVFDIEYNGAPLGSMDCTTASIPI